MEKSHPHIPPFTPLYLVYFLCKRKMKSNTKLWFTVLIRWLFHLQMLFLICYLTWNQFYPTLSLQLLIWQMLPLFYTNLNVSPQIVCYYLSGYDSTISWFCLRTMPTSYFHPWSLQCHLMSNLWIYVSL